LHLPPPWHLYPIRMLLAAVINSFIKQATTARTI
jgi:hypothetical protein